MTDFIIKYRWIIISSCIFLGIGFGLLIPKSKTDPEIRNYVPSTMESRVITDNIESEFGTQDMIMLIFKDSCIITSGNLIRIKSIDKEISRLGGISRRISPFTMRNIKGEEGMMLVEPLIQSIPSDTGSVRSLGKEILANRFAKDVVFSSDLTTASITATISKSIPETETLKQVDSIIVAHPGQATVLKGGLPYIRRYIISDVQRDAIFLVPLALIIMLLVLKLTLGDWKCVLMPFTVVILSTAIGMGLIPLLGWKMSIISLLVPVIMIAVANNYGIYLVSRRKELLESGFRGNKRETIRAVTGLLDMPVLFSGLTTVAGILGLLSHSIIPARQVGVLAAIGVSFALTMSLIFIPALMYIIPYKSQKVKKSAERHDIIKRILSFLSQRIISHPGKILITAAVLTILLTAGIPFLRINTNQEDYFPGNHPVKMATGIINGKFGGSQTISVMISGDIKDPVLMKDIDSLSGKIKGMYGVGNVFSISDAIKEMSKALYDKNEPGYDRVPDSREAIAQMFELYNMSGDPDDFSQLMNFDNTKAHILIRLSDPNNIVIKTVKEKITEYTKHFPAEISIGGYALIMAEFAGKIINGQILSLLFALVTVFILLAIIFKSIKGGLIGSIPLAVSILITFGFMGFSGIALDAATAILSSIMIGVGVDFTIQYLWRYNAELMKGNSADRATTITLTTTGKSIIINALGVMAGFSVLIFSGFMSIRFFGYLVLLSIGSCLICAIVIIPAFVLWFRPSFIEKVINKKIIEDEKSNYSDAVYHDDAERLRATSGRPPIDGEKPGSINEYEPEYNHEPRDN